MKQWNNGTMGQFDDLIIWQWTVNSGQRAVNSKQWQWAVGAQDIAPTIGAGKKPETMNQ